MTMSHEGLLFTVRYIGFVTVKPSGIGPGMVQRPLTELYLSYIRTSPMAQERNLTVTDRGLSIEGPGMNKEQYSIPDIPFWHAVQFVTVKSKRDKYKGAFEPLDQEFVMNFENMYFDIDKKMNYITKLEHPAIFALVLRRRSGLRALDCHAYICDSQDEAKSIAKGLNRSSKTFKDVAPGVFDYNPWSAPTEKVPLKQMDDVQSHQERLPNESHDELPSMRHVNEGSSNTQHGAPTNSQRWLRMASDPLPNQNDDHSLSNHPISGAAALLMNAQLGPSNNANETRRGVPIGVTYPFPVTGGRVDNSLQLNEIGSNDWENAYQNSNGMSYKNSNQDIIIKNSAPQLQPNGKNNVYVNFPVSNELNGANTGNTNIQEHQNQGFESAGGEKPTVNLGQGYSFMGVAPHVPEYEDDDTTTPQHGARPQPIGELPDHTYVNTGGGQAANKEHKSSVYDFDGKLARKAVIPSKDLLLSPTSHRLSQIQDNGPRRFQLQARSTSEQYEGASTYGVYPSIGNNPGIVNTIGQPQIPFTPAMSRPLSQTGYSPRASSEHRVCTPDGRQDFIPTEFDLSRFTQGMPRKPIMQEFTPRPAKPSGTPFYKFQASTNPPPSPETDYWHNERNGENINPMAHNQSKGMPSFDNQYSTSPGYETSLYQEIPESSTGGYLNYKAPHESRIHEYSAKEKDINYEPFTDQMRVLESQRQQDRPIAKVAPHKIGGIRVLPKLPLAEVDTNPNPAFPNRKEPKRRSRDKSQATQVPANVLHSNNPPIQADEEAYFKNDIKKESKQNKASQAKYESNWQFGHKKKSNCVNECHLNVNEGVSIIDNSIGEKLLLNKKKDAEIASAISHLNVDNSQIFGTGLEKSLGYLP